MLKQADRRAAAASGPPGWMRWPPAGASTAGAGLSGQRRGAAVERYFCSPLAAGATIYPAEPLRAATDAARGGARRHPRSGPYHGPRQACGLAFAVAPGAPPPSLRNIYKRAGARIRSAAGHRAARPGHWRARALLLNTSLTVEAGRAGSHACIGWQA